MSTFFSSTNIHRISIWTECSNPFSQIGNIPGTFSYTKSSMLLCPFLGSIKCEIPAILKRIFMIILCRLQTVHKYLRRKKIWLSSNTIFESYKWIKILTHGRSLFIEWIIFIIIRCPFQIKFMKKEVYLCYKIFCSSSFAVWFFLNLKPFAPAKQIQNSFNLFMLQYFYS